MSNNTNYTAQLKDHLYACIKACQDAIDACKEVKHLENAALELEKRNASVQACRNCINACKLLNNSASVYLGHATETDSIARVQNAVKQSNICIAGCNQIIEACDHVNKKCPDMIASTINTLEDCIEACRKCAEHKDL